MQRVPPRRKEDETWIYHHMSNHYRRILNAKKTIDNGPPECYKPRTTSPDISSRRSCVNSKRDISGLMTYGPQTRSISKTDLHLLDRVGWNTNNEPTAYSNQEMPYPYSTKDIITSKNFTKPRRPNSCVMLRPKSVVRCPSKNRVPKLRLKGELPVEQLYSKDWDMCRDDKLIKAQSLTSDRDSAYEGGVSSVPDSLSPTPEHKLYAEKKLKEAAEGKGNFTVETQTECPSSCSCFQLSSPVPSVNKDDRFYIKLIQDITNEILEKNLFTNKALNRIIQKHKDMNSRTLDSARMELEIEKLREQLGITKSNGDLQIETADLGPQNTKTMDEKMKESNSWLYRNPSVSVGDENRHSFIYTLIQENPFSVPSLTENLEELKLEKVSKIERGVGSHTVMVHSSAVQTTDGCNQPATNSNSKHHQDGDSPTTSKSRRQTFVKSEANSVARQHSRPIDLTSLQPEPTSASILTVDRVDIYRRIQSNSSSEEEASETASSMDSDDEGHVSSYVSGGEVRSSHSEVRTIVSDDEHSAGPS